jgi:DNA modification methylase
MSKLPLQKTGSLNLSENEKRDIVKYLEAGKPLPEKYRFLLFKDDREVELIWNGKTSEVTNVVLPFQVIEQIDEPREGKEFGDGGTLFDTSGKQITGWTNKLIWGDNKLILSSLKNGPMRKEIEAQGGLKLVYIDPPFDVGADFSMNIEIGEGGETENFTKKPSVIEEIAYRDTWGKGADSFIAMIYERLKLIHGLLAEDGSIYLHCDYRVSGYLRLVLDEVFGKDNFQNEIIWHFIKGASGNDRFGRKHQTIFWYSKSNKWNFNRNEIGVAYNPETLARAQRGEARYSLTAEELEERGKNPGDVWSDLHPVQGNGLENTGYATQKPEAFIERIIKASSKEGDLIADFFCGSGTTLAVAEKLGRKWIGTDLGKFGIHTSRKRMIGVQRELKKAGKDFRAFEILNVGKYERERFLTSNDDLRAEERAKQTERKEQEFIQLILSAYQAESVQSFTTIVGKRRDRLVAIGPINLPVSSKFIQEIVAECKEKGLTKVDVLGFDYEMGLQFDEYKEGGIDIAFKIIPREVFDKRAIERGHVHFYDIAYIDVKPIITGKGDIKELSIEITDFSVFYNQDNENLEEQLKAGKSKIVVENGQVIKISKDKGCEELTLEVLTKKWSDWIDYWAVDYNFADRKEIIRVPKTHGDNLFEKGIVQDLFEYEEVWTGDYIFDNEWQSFRTKKNRNLEFISAPVEMQKGNYKVAVKVVDIFGNDTTKVIDVTI